MTSNTTSIFPIQDKIEKTSIMRGSIEITPVPQIIEISKPSQPPAQPTPQQYTPNVTVSQTQITLPTSSIQLPIAPYAPSYGNGIPTNVVNPIPQYNPNQRPTNRVLPMQTVQPKVTASPPTPPEPKPLLEVESKKPKIVAERPPVTKPEPVLVEIPSPTSSQMPMENKTPSVDEDEDLAMSCDAQSDIFEKDDLLIDESSKEEDIDTFPKMNAEEAFDKLKSETPAMQQQPERVSDSSTSEVKSKISEILCNLEDDDCNKNMLTATLYDLPTESREATNACDEQMMVDQKENMHPEMMAATDNSVNSMKYSTLVTIPKEQPSLPKYTGPRMLYEIQSQDGFTYKSTSITEIWEKVFEAVQLARRAHGLSPLPEGPLADMCGYQMMGLKTNALKYLLEQLPGVEKCSNYKPTYHKRADSIASQASSSGYCSDYEELKENFYGAARCEGYSTRSEYDMFSWLASRHRKQPIQICVPPNGDNELIPRSVQACPFEEIPTF